MQPKHLNTLELPKILERLAGFAAFSASKELARELTPSPFFSQVRDWQAETTEAVRLLSVKDNIGIGGARDVRPQAARCQRGLLLTPLELLEVRQTLISARELSRTLIRLEDSFPRLADIAQRIEECPGVVNAIGQAIDDHAEVKDSASPALARIRRDLSVAHDRLMEKLNRIIASSSTSQYLQEALITQRAGRYVIPVKADFKGRVNGIVHDQSASGATVFVEPVATVELNNKWRQLQLDEEDEIRKILAELSALVGQHRELIDHTLEALADLDLTFAKAKYAAAIEAVEPRLIGFKDGVPLKSDHAGNSTDGTIKLLAARHPLLDPKTVVPIDVIMEKDTSMLIITGPNTGGKTVSLKTIGLLSAMAQAGLHIPAAEDSAVLVFRHIFADIGDEQSIEQSLSTFSGHMTNIVQILQQCDPESLVIFDELGAGTDPVEGSALARAILSQLLARQVTTFVATHYSELKAFAHTTAGVTNASMEFDVETLTPTYRLRIGLPGASNAFTIARRLGLSQEIIDTAQGLVSEESQQVEAMLSEIRQQTEAARQTRRQAELERQKIEEQNRELEHRLKEIDDERRDILNSARADARREIKAARTRIRALETEFKASLEQRQTAPKVTAEVEETEAALESLEAEIVPEAAPVSVPVEPPEPKEKPTGPIRMGDRVFVPQFSTTAEVVGFENGEAEVQLGHFRATVPVAELELKERAAAVAAQEQPRRTARSVPDIESPGMELDLRGQVAEDALINLDKYLDRAFLAKLPSVRIIHGKGSGVLRQVVRDELRDHPQVSSYRPGRPGEGGDGVTVAKMAVG